MAEAIGSISGAVARALGLVDEVSVASRQQAQGIDQVTQAIAQMEKVEPFRWRGRGRADVLDVPKCRSAEVP